jgi:phosphoglucomutase/phosphomannomutase
MAAPPQALADLTRRVEQAAAGGQLSPDAAANLTRWLTQPAYRKYFDRLAALVRAGDFDTLERHFWQQIPFGTGGRRGVMGEFGPATINERTIAESAHGLAAYLKQATGGTSKSLTSLDEKKGKGTGGLGSPPYGAGGRAVVACDTRNRSQEFARLTATTFAAHGLHVFLFDSFRSTPELSFAVRHLGCDVGAMISASHNPPSDNGFKAYWNHGGQVLAPHDAGIIACVENAAEIPEIDFDRAVAEGRIEIVGAAVDRAYQDAVLAMSLSDARELPALYTPLHGVGETNCWQVLERAGFRGVEIFGPQRKPDGNFPNVPDRLPNPERPQVFEPLFDTARQKGAEVLLGSDPDADRLAACVRGRDGKYVHLNGNQIGALLADYILLRRAARGDLTPRHYVVETLVTTRLVGAIARAHGVRVIDDLLVGFKYIAETMDAEGPEQFVFGTEESLGYLAGTYARDKDAGIATLYLAECAAALRRDGKSLLDRLDEIYVGHGYYLETQFSKTCEGAEGSRLTAKLMAALRATPPAALGGVTFAEVRDYQRHEVRRLPDNARTAALPKPDGNLLILESAPGDREFRVAVRPSGTEPKIKFYLFGRAACPTAAALPSVKQESAEALRRLESDLKAWLDGQLSA